MSSEASKTADDVRFNIEAKSGDARTGKLHVKDTVIETPTLLPVVNFYAGGTKNSLFGGGVHRTMKEFIVGHEVIGGGCYDDYFDGVMTSVASLTDYNITKERYEDYISQPIKERDSFESYEGVLFIDSGGYKLLQDGGLDGSDFHIAIDQQKAYKIQKRLGADIIVNLDQPIAPDDSYDERIEKARTTAANLIEFLELSEGHDGARYLTVHGYNYSMIDTFLDVITENITEDELKAAFDGIALGSLVPRKDNRGVLIDAVTGCREALDERGFDDLPLHVLGISNTAMPLLAAVGADSFDSTAYLQSAVNGKYHLSFTETVHFNEADFSECGCPVCSNETLVSRMNGNAEYQKDILGPVAMHNLIVQKKEMAQLREKIQAPGNAPLIQYLEDMFERDKRMRRYAHRVVNKSLGGYFI